MGEGVSQIQVECAMLEIYLEELRDLLAPTDGASARKPGTRGPAGRSSARKLVIKDTPLEGTRVVGLQWRKAESAAEIIQTLDRGLAQRTIAATAMNQTSSRSHTVFQIRIKQIEVIEMTARELEGNIHLVDLAGSERIKKTKAEGVRVSEAKEINKSLTYLGEAQGRQRPSPPLRPPQPRPCSRSRCLTRAAAACRAHTCDARRVTLVIECASWRHLPKDSK